MNAEALGRYGVLERMGIFGIELDSPRGAARFLGISLRVLSDPGNVLWITAEGHFTDNRRRPVVLRPGIAHLARRVPDADNPAAGNGIPVLEREPAGGAGPLWHADRYRTGTVPLPSGQRTWPPP